MFSPAVASRHGAPLVRGMHRGFSPHLINPAAAAAASASFLLQKRFLGNEVRGPDFDPLDLKTWKVNAAKILPGAILVLHTTFACHYEKRGKKRAQKYL